MKNESSKSGLFLMELILAILFFSIASAICAQLFAAAHLTSTQTRQQSNAVAAAQSAIACLQAENGDLKSAAPLIAGTTDAKGMTVNYDANWNACAKADAVYRLTVSPISHSETALVTVSRISDETVLFDVTCGWHAPITG